MPRGHPYTQEELLLRKRARAHRRYMEEKKQALYYRLHDKIQKRLEFARQQGRIVTGWTVEEELQLLANYSYQCSFCYRQVDDLDLILRDPTLDFCIENMLPICYSCLIDQHVNIIPLQIVKHLSIAQLPEGFNKERLKWLCVHEQVRVYVVATLNKHSWQALIGYPELLLNIKVEYRHLRSHEQAMTHTPQQVKLYGDRLFESEARALFPEYKSLAYHYV